MKTKMKENRKNIFVILLIIAMLASIMMVGCGKDTNAEKTSSNTDVVSQEVEASADDEKTDVTSEPDDEEQQTKAKERATEPAKPDVEKATKKQKTAATSTKKSTEAAKKTVEQTQTTKATSTTKATEAAKAKVCYITVEGYCSSKQIEIKGGESVYDILKSSGASVSARNTGYGVYVEGINGRFEFDEGPTSGWVYTVNGSRPSESCSKYTVKSGDKIVWTYVTEV